MIKAIIGLGNPGRKYMRTRHNIGFMVVDALVERFGGKWREDKGSEAQLGEIEIEGQKFILVKPQTYMNASGEAVMKIVRSKRLKPEEIIMVADDINLDPGVIRFRFDGSDGGHKGLRSVIGAIGQSFYRLRIGVGKNIDKSAEDYVLMPIEGKEMAVFDDIVDKVTQNLIKYLNGGYSHETVNLNIN